MPVAASPQLVILGAGGFLGLALLQRNQAFYSSILCVSRSYQYMNDPESIVPVQYVQASVTDTSAYINMIQEWSVIVYSAGSTNIELAEKRGIVDVNDHLTSLSSALEAIKYAGLRPHRFILVSSAGTVYGESPISGSSEYDYLAPKSIYGLRNVMVEKYLQLFCVRDSIPFAILRVANPYGVEQLRVNRKGLIVSLMLSVFSGEKVILRGGGTQVRDYVNVGDFCRLVALLGEACMSNTNPIINVGTGRSLQSIEILKAVSEIVQSEIPLGILHSNPAYDIQRCSLDVSIFKALVSPQPLEKSLLELWISIRNVNSV